MFPAIALVSLLATATAEETFAVSIGVEGCSDVIGSSLVYRLRETLGASELFTLTPDQTPGGLRLHLTCLEIDDDGAEISVAIATTVGVNHRFIAVDALVMGKSKVSESVDFIVSTLDDRTRRFRRSSKGGESSE